MDPAPHRGDGSTPTRAPAHGVPTIDLTGGGRAPGSDALAGDVPAGDVPGGDAERPGQIPRRGWWQILRRALKEFNRDQGTLIAAGVAYYGFLALVPTLIAATLLYGLVSDPGDVQRQVESLSSALPGEARTLLAERMTALASASGTGLSLGLVLSLLVALWSASGGVSALMTAVNDAYDETDERGFLRKKGLALGLTLGAIVFFVLTVGLVAVVPALTGAADLPGPVLVAAQAVRWLILLTAVVLALAVVYRLAPDRDGARLRWISVGAVTATVVWVVATLGFSLYVSNFSSYDKTYGPLAGVVVVLLWLWMSTVAVLLGAEINAEAEQQTARDTTVGAEQPLGRRGAVKADSLPPREPADT